MKKFLEKLAKFILVIIIIWVVYIVVNFVYGKILEVVLNNSLASGIDISTAQENKDDWKNISSDIHGMTLWDKYQAGLSVAWGSDTDGDGLSDKDEIERYGSDPLKISTSGDLYTDMYKVNNDMEIDTYYEYQGNNEFVYNECGEVILQAELPTDFNAVVEKVSNARNIGTNQVYAEYRVYNFSGKFLVDVTTVLKEFQTELSDICVYVSDGSNVKKSGFTKNEDGLITLKQNFESKQIYNIYITEKSFWGGISVVFSSALNALEGTDAEEVSGAGLVIDFPLLTALFGTPVDIYYENIDDGEKSDILKRKIISYTEEYLGDGEGYYVDEHCYGKSKYEVSAMYSILKNVIPMFDVSELSENQLSWVNFIFMYYSYEDKLAFDELNRTEKADTSSTSGFNFMEDTLPFGNFNSEYGPNGNCAGISHLTAYLFNNGYYDKSGTLRDISWNIGAEENKTLLNKGLADYKSKTFIEEHDNSGKIDMTSLSEGEQEFVKMIGVAYIEGNQRANYIFNNLYGGENAKIEYDYSLVESMKAYLESGKILDVYLRMVDGTGHAVNVYGYKIDENDERVVWFQVYDSNFPQNNVGEHTLSDEGLNLRVEKLVNNSGDGYTFMYDYFPLENREYGATSNKSISENGFIIVMDENWNILND